MSWGAPTVQLGAGETTDPADILLERSAHTRIDSLAPAARWPKCNAHAETIEIGQAPLKQFDRTGAGTRLANGAARSRRASGRSRRSSGFGFAGPRDKLQPAQLLQAVIVDPARQQPAGGADTSATSSAAFTELRGPRRLFHLFQTPWAKGSG